MCAIKMTNKQMGVTDAGGVFDEKDVVYMREAIAESRKGALIAPPNPAVGCVIVRDGREISRGYTHAPGSAHAEVDAIENAVAKGESIKGATLYVTLEPCSHYGRTPPCALRIIREGAARVVVATLDPNPQVAGRGIAMLREAGIEVLIGVCEDEAIESNIGFLTRMRLNRPWVRMKIAAGIDGLTALANGQSQWITCEQSRRDGRLLRAYAQGLLTGIGTVLADDPQMNVREAGQWPSPRKYILDTNARTPVTAKILQGESTTIFVGDKAFDLDVNALKDAGAQVRELPSSAESDGLDLREALRVMAEDGINVLHVEAGAGVNGALLRAGLVDEIVCYVAPAIMGHGPGWAFLPEFQSMDEVLRWRFHQVEAIGDDLKIVLRQK